MIITHVVMFKLLKGASESGAPTFNPAWAANATTLVGSGVNAT